MYEYTWYQWLTFFFVYCFFGWVFESSYVSAKSGRFVNRGFLRLPLLPLYGTGAVMMLWVSLPVKDNLFMVYIAGVTAATLLEYATGWAMEKLFKMKYWDYSSQKYNLKGYICLSSSLAWGFLTIFLTEVIHQPVESWVLGLPRALNIGLALVVTLLFLSDCIESVKTALDLAKVLDAMTSMRAELDELQVQMALLKAEAGDRAAGVREEAAAKLDHIKLEAEKRAAGFKEDATHRINSFVDHTVEKVEELGEQLEERLPALSERFASLTEKRRTMSLRMGYYRRSILKGNPSASSARFAEALRELKEIAERKKKEICKRQ